MSKRHAEEKKGSQKPKLKRSSSQGKVYENGDLPCSLDRDSGFQDQGGSSMDVDENDNTVIPQSSTLEENTAGDNERNRLFAENVLSCFIKIGGKKGKNPKKPKNQKACDNGSNIPNCIVEKCCAIYNAGGGVLELPIANFEDLDAPLPDLDKFWQTVEPKLNALIKPYSYTDVFDRKYDGNSGKVHLFIKRIPNHFCTLKYNLFLPGDSGTYDASYSEAIDILSKKQHSSVEVSLANLPKLEKEFVYGDKVSFHESKQIQLKHYESEKILDAHSKHNQCDTMRRTISAFANACGGVIVLGVTDEGVVEGQNLEGDSTEAVVQRVNDLINKMHWVDGTPKREEHWDIEFFPVKGKENCFIIVIKVAKVPGGVFAKCPKSVELRPDEDDSEGQVLTFDEWKQRMVGGQANSKGVEAVLSKFKCFSLGAPKHELLTIEGGVDEIRNAFFEVKDDWPLSPKGAVSNLPKAAQDVITQIQDMLANGGTHGIILVSRSWLRDVDPQAACPDGLICDLLLVTSDYGGLNLVTLCEPGSEESVAEYSLTTARDLKKSLVLEGGCDEKFYISNRVVPCSATRKIDIPCANKQYPKLYDMAYTPEKLYKILEALVIVLAKVPSTLSNSLGVSFMNLLTVRQFQLVHEQIEDCSCKELWIKGPAGSGKTLVAVEFMRELRRRDEHLRKYEILYVCENKGLREQVRRADVCECVCRKSFMTGSYFLVKHVVMDEVQSFRAEDGDWLEKARRRVRPPSDDPDKDPGFLWLFIDNSQVNHHYETGIPAETLQVPHFRLKKVIRNSKTIFEYSKKFVHENAASKIELGHDFPGDEVKRVNCKRPKLTSRLKKVLKSLFGEGYSEGEITVLYGKEDCIPDNLCKELNLPRYVDAERNNADSLVVSTLRMYSGLDRPVVVLVNLGSTLPYRSQVERAIYCAVTRAMVKLVVIDVEW
ncbi:schlafen family member 13-like [Oculina patagonica]